MRSALVALALIVLLGSAAEAQLGKGTITAPALTKGTQGANGFSTQDLKDAGRTRVTFTVDSVAPAASETLITFVKDVAGVATTGQTTYSVTAAKTFRLQVFSLTFTQSSTTIVKVRVGFRENTGGACTAASALVLRLETGPTTTTAVASTGTEAIVVPIPDGLEFPASDSLCMSAIATSAAGTMTITAVGYEY